MRREINRQITAEILGGGKLQTAKQKEKRKVAKQNQTKNGQQRKKQWISEKQGWRYAAWVTYKYVWMHVCVCFHMCLHNFTGKLLHNSSLSK